MVENPVTEIPGNDLYNQGCAKLNNFLSAVSDIDKAKSELAIEFCNIFLGYGSNSEEDINNDQKFNAAYPYESVYISNSKTLHNESAEQLVKEFRGRGFKPEKKYVIAEDHIACELEFTAFLISQEYKANDDNVQIHEIVKDELTFIDSHILNWFDKFSSELQKHAELDFYVGLSELTLGWINEDRENLRVLLLD
jgi:TorA maturation chaperone TorD